MVKHPLDDFRYRVPKGRAGWIDTDGCEWTIVVGDRIRRLRRDRDMTLVELAILVERPRGGRGYSASYLSRIERGWAHAAVSTYISIAGALGVAPWRLLGPEEVQKEVTDGELTLIQFLREVGVAPHQALAIIADRRAVAGPAASADHDRRTGMAVRHMVGMEGVGEDLEPVHQPRGWPREER